MKNHFQFLIFIFQFLIALCAVFLSSCTKVETYEDTPTGNFEALWHIIDTKYCFLDYKAEEYGLNWNTVYRRYKRKIDDGMSHAGLKNFIRKYNR